MPSASPHSLPFNQPDAFLEGQVMVIDKPLTWTSFDVVNKVRYALRGFTGVKKIKVGHAGTLDPLATGVLVVCCGRATKTIDSLQAQAKVYTATIRLGAHTPSLDAETEVDRWAEDPAQVLSLSRENIQDATATLTGLLEQRPPLFSAKKVDGVKAYDAARKGADIKLRTFIRHRRGVQGGSVAASRSARSSCGGCRRDHSLQQGDIHPLARPGLGRRPRRGWHVDCIVPSLKWGFSCGPCMEGRRPRGPIQPRPRNILN